MPVIDWYLDQLSSKRLNSAIDGNKYRHTAKPYVELGGSHKSGREKIIEIRGVKDTTRKTTESTSLGS